MGQVIRRYPVFFQIWRRHIKTIFFKSPPPPQFFFQIPHTTRHQPTHATRPNREPARHQTEATRAPPLPSGLPVRLGRRAASEVFENNGKTRSRLEHFQTPRRALLNTKLEGERQASSACLCIASSALGGTSRPPAAVAVGARTVSANCREINCKFGIWTTIF